MDIGEFLEFAKKKSIRSFKPDPVPDEYIEKVLDAARWSMYGVNARARERNALK
jgi:nitroreductase